MAVTGISNLILLMFSIIAIVFILSFLTPFFKGITDTIGMFLGGVGSEKLATGIYNTLSDAHNTAGTVTHYYKIILGRGFYYIGIWQSNGWNGVCPAGAFCVVYFAPDSNVTDVINAIKTGNTNDVTVVKSVLAFYTTDFTVDTLNGNTTSTNIGVLVYVDGIKSTTWGIVAYYDKEHDSYTLSISAISGVSFFKVVKV